MGIETILTIISAANITLAFMGLVWTITRSCYYTISTILTLFGLVYITIWFHIYADEIPSLIYGARLGMNVALFFLIFVNLMSVDNSLKCNSPLHRNNIKTRKSDFVSDLSAENVENIENVGK